MVSLHLNGAATLNNPGAPWQHPATYSLIVARLLLFGRRKSYGVDIIRRWRCFGWLRGLDWRRVPPGTISKRGLVSITINHRHPARLRLLAIGQRLAEAQAQAAPFGLDAEDLRHYLLAFLYHVPRMLYPLIGQLRDVNETLDPRFDLGERPKCRQLRHAGWHDLAHKVATQDVLPRLAPQPLEAECYLLLLAIHAQDQHLDLVAYLHDLTRMGDWRP